MDLQGLLDSKHITKYRLSQISGVPKTTVIDICAGRSYIRKCSAGTVQQLARALEMSMEALLELDAPLTGYDRETGLPEDKGYFECGLPLYLKASIKNMQASWSVEDSGGKDYHWDIAWCDLNADINSVEVDGIITHEQAWYLREKYLRMRKR